MQITQTGRRVVNRRGFMYILGWGTRRILGLLTSSLRVLPDFIIIGAQRSGSTSLYNYLIEHPDILPGLMKEVHFFDNYYHKGVNWYRSFFPLSASIQYLERAHQRRFITGEATPYYLYYPHAPRRIKACCPNVKLIALLRNPVERAYSHYHHEVRLGIEELPFAEAIEREKSDVPRETAKILEDENYRSFSHQNYSYISRGIYIEQLEAWNKYFSREKMLVLKSEELFSNPDLILDRTYEFLGISKKTPTDFQVHNSLDYKDIEPELYEALTDYFEPYNHRLYQFLDLNLDWEKTAH
jgi:hypothetical protein